MTAALKRIEQTREALVDALAERDWETIGKLDLACRACVDDVISQASDDEPELRSNLEELLGVYRQLIDIAVGERQAIVDEMSQIQRAKNAAKVYHLFG
ncbi:MULTISPECIES: flagellar protein FliT [unclassified Pseudomonas]|uniref:flagellar protein FliT n=1 Tax=unclassified Pseudomonas TaxID=196821 RepID=UPI0025ED40EC|nr:MULTISPECIES: flagellar protein FliT [unclassified Pseudomonas]